MFCIVSTRHSDQRRFHKRGTVKSGISEIRLREIYSRERRAGEISGREVSTPKRDP